MLNSTNIRFFPFVFGVLLLFAGCTPLIRDTRVADPLTVAIATNMPESYAKRFVVLLNQTATLRTAAGVQPLVVLDQPQNAAVQIKLGGLTGNSVRLLERFFVAVTPFATITDDVSLTELQLRWQGAGSAPLLVTPSVADLLGGLWGPTSALVVDEATLLPQLEATTGSVGLLPFDQLDPRYKVLTVDGVNVLNNWLEPAKYPLGVLITVEGKEAAVVGERLRALGEPSTNRAADQLATLIMTGVTAMSRATASRMERVGVLYPAAIISSTLAAADITHVSNEVPFLDDCVVNNTENNLILCSHTSYWAALQAIGADIVGLSGNHVNDFGRDGAHRSLQFYREHKIPIYGSGLTIEEACAPLRWEHNGNTFAFFAALAFGPPGAWVTDSEPGACYYYDHKAMILEAVAQLAQEVDIVSVELQYLETYNPFPTSEQVREFRELRTAGADLVTGVQSHVPQALEPYGAKDVGGNGMIVYGLGNLFFDQMWSWETRTELYARHTIYQGKLISSEVLTGVLEDFAQPRWATANERAEILTRIFAATPVRE
jgi:poly-gamma-glutamate synthesis protein (capsule biosynthesis protein)